MKKSTIKNYLLLIVASFCISATFTSCLDDDDNDSGYDTATMTTEEVNAYMAKVTGNYEGTLKYFYIKGQKTLADSIDVTFTVNSDKTIEVKNVADSLWNVYLNETNNNVQAALKKATTANTMLISMNSFAQTTDSKGSVTEQWFYAVPKNNKYEFQYTNGEYNWELCANFMTIYNEYPYQYPSMGMYNDSKRSLAIVMFFKNMTVNSTIQQLDYVSQFTLSGNKTFAIVN